MSSNPIEITLDGDKVSLNLADYMSVRMSPDSAIKIAKKLYAKAMEANGEDVTHVAFLGINADE